MFIFLFCYASASPSEIPRRIIPTITAATQAYWDAFSLSFKKILDSITDITQYEAIIGAASIGSDAIA